MLTGLFGEEKSAVDIHIQHAFPIIEVVVFGWDSTGDSGVGAQDIDFAEIFDNLIPGFLDALFVCCVALVRVEFCGRKTLFFDFGVDGFNGFSCTIQGKIDDCTMASRETESCEDLLTKTLRCASIQSTDILTAYRQECIIPSHDADFIVEGEARQSTDTSVSFSLVAEKLSWLNGFVEWAKGYRKAHVRRHSDDAE